MKIHSAASSLNYPTGIDSDLQPQFRAIHGRMAQQLSFAAPELACLPGFHQQEEQGINTFKFGKLREFRRSTIDRRCAGTTE
jgi:hypothetical protein